MRLALILTLLPCAAFAGMPPDIRFPAIDGGELAMDEWRGRPVLVVNTASMCAFTGQYDDLQALADRYDRLVVLAVPSDDFRQELATGEQVANFCAVNFDLTIPMTDITHVTGKDAHPFYAWLKREHDFTPGWNFNKVLIDAKGEFVDSWGSSANPTDESITTEIEALLP